jgi:TonB family protein
VPEIAQLLERQVGVSARYVEHSTTAGPSILGVFTRTIALPADFGDLAPGFQRAVICHELLHVKRWDTLVSLLEETVLAVFWFHPLLWVVRHQIRVAREQSVDATVLDIVGDRSEYVRCLVEMSGHDLMPHLSRAGAAMIRTRELRARVNAIFEEVHMSRARRRIVSTALVTVVGFAGWSAAIYAPLQAMHALAVPVEPGMVRIPSRITPGAQLPATSTMSRKQIKASYAEYPAEALEKRISGTVRVNITINPAGEVSTADVVAGPAELRASAFKAAMGLKYTPAASTTSATIYIEYRLDSQSWGVRISDGSGASATARYSRPETTPASGALRVGGNIAPPKKTKDVPPEYPAAARSARVQGVVILEATIDGAGNVEDVKVLRSVPLLDQAAIDAVKQWQYTPTLLNGQPVSVVMTVTVNFSLRGSANAVVLKITLPNGQTLAMNVRDGDMGYLDIPDVGRFDIAPSIGNPASPSSVTRVSIYERADSGPRLLGTVDVALAAGTVQSATTPSFGIELVERISPAQQ